MFIICIVLYCIAKPLVNTISKFDAQVRRHVVISCSAEEEADATVPTTTGKIVVAY